MVIDLSVDELQVIRRAFVLLPVPERPEDVAVRRKISEAIEKRHILDNCRNYRAINKDKFDISHAEKIDNKTQEFISVATAKKELDKYSDEDFTHYGLYRDGGSQDFRLKDGVYYFFRYPYNYVIKGKKE